MLLEFYNLTICEQEPPLYLHITSQSKEGLKKAIEEVEELMQQELPELTDVRRRNRREPEEERDERGRVRSMTPYFQAYLLTTTKRKWPDAKIPIMLEPVIGFNLRAAVVGTGGSYVKHIQQETRCRVQIKGRGSGFIEQETNAESDEQMYLHVSYVSTRSIQTSKTTDMPLVVQMPTK